MDDIFEKTVAVGMGIVVTILVMAMLAAGLLIMSWPVLLVIGLLKWIFT